MIRKYKHVNILLHDFGLYSGLSMFDVLAWYLGWFNMTILICSLKPPRIRAHKRWMSGSVVFNLAYKKHRFFPFVWYEKNIVLVKIWILFFLVWAPKSRDPRQKERLWGGYGYCMLLLWARDTPMDSSRSDHRYPAGDFPQFFRLWKIGWCLKIQCLMRGWSTKD